MKQTMLRMAAVYFFAAILFCVPVNGQILLSARNAVLIDAESGRILWENACEEQTLIASTTKIMTGLLVAEDCKLSDTVVIDSEMCGVEGSSLDLREGEVLSVEALIYGMMLHSGNDAAVALAIHHSGSVAAFVAAMNRKAQELSLQNTHFENPHGLDGSEHFSSALDLARLSAAAMKHPIFSQVVSTKTIQFGTRIFRNHNKLLWRCDGVIGVKTGYTKAAGRVLVSCAQRDGRKLIAVTISAPNDWVDHEILLNYGFSNFPLRKVIEEGDLVESVPVVGGAKLLADIVADETVSLALREDEKVQFYKELPDFVYPPVVAGERAGTLVICCGENEIKRIPLVW